MVVVTGAAGAGFTSAAFVTTGACIVAGVPARRIDSVSSEAWVTPHRSRALL